MDPINLMDDDFVQAEFLGLVPVLAYVLTRERNAWHSTRSSRYRKAFGVKHSKTEAIRHAELQRRQGTFFVVREVPSLVLRSTVGPVCLVDFHGALPFGRWDGTRGAPLLRIGQPLGDVLAAFEVSGYWRSPRPSVHSLIQARGRFKGFEPMPPRRPFKQWVSASSGGNYELHWIERAPSSPYSRTGVSAVHKIYEGENEPGVVASAEERYWRLLDG